MLVLGVQHSGSVVLIIKNISKHCQVFLGEKNHHQLRTDVCHLGLESCAHLGENILL